MRPLLAAVAVVLVAASAAHAHGEGVHRGFVATVSAVEPPLPGLLVTVLGGHEKLAVRNLTQKIVRFAQPSVVLHPGESATWVEPRIAPSGPADREGLVRNWRIPGEADGKPFAIVGFLGYSGPLPDRHGTRPWVVALAGVGAAAVVAAALALPRRRREGEG